MRTGAELANFARLDFAVAGGRTELLRQHVAYPFHVTRPFYLDAARPDLATLYLQSASGGIYGGDRLQLDARFGPGTTTCVTTQSATIVHDCRDNLAQQAARITLAAGALVLFAPDPLVLFPGARVQIRTEISLAPGASALLQDGFACHDPSGASRRFRSYRLETIVSDDTGRVLVADRGTIDGAALDSPASPLGPWRACGTSLLLGATWVDPGRLQGELDAMGCYAGAGDLPNEAGAFLRVLAPDGGTLARGLNLVFRRGFEALIGYPPAPRKK